MYQKKKKRGYKNNSSITSSSSSSNDKPKEMSIKEKFHEIKQIPNEYQLIWTNINFTEEFYSVLDNLNDTMQEEIYRTIINILKGHFQGTEEHINYEADFLYGSYFYTFQNKTKLLFIIYFKNNDDTFTEQIEFINISSSVVVLKNSINQFVEDFGSINSGLEFDKTGLLNDSNIFFEKIEKKNEEIIKYPFTFGISKVSNRKIKVNISKKVHEDGFNMSVFDLEKVISYVVELIEKRKSYNYDSVLGYIQSIMVPSKKEKILIDTNKNVIISGRPGTGKTYIILIKTILLVYHCMNEQCLIEHKDNSRVLLSRLFQENLLKQYPNEHVKIVFTSLSQTLCAKVEELFEHKMSEIGFPYEKSKLSDIINLTSFHSITKYPLFVNFRKLIFLIDASLVFQFFDRAVGNKMTKEIQDCEIKYRTENKYPCNQVREGSKRNNFTSYQGTKTHFFRSSCSDNIVYCKEVNDTMFIEKFSQRCKGEKLDPYEVYSQIISVIKGSLFSYLGEYNGLTRYDYHKIGVKLSRFTEKERDKIFDIFIEYEQWKQSQKYFDMQDVVNHLIRQVIIELAPEKRKLIDYLFIDEVQDFSINQLYLMSLITRNIKVLAGDTCQTISKTNRFRFCDINGIYYTFNQIDSDIIIPKQVQIILNFRCNSKILKLAHFFFGLIFKFFPETLDKVKLDFSKVVGTVKPCLINNFDNFMSFLISDNDKNENKNKKGESQKYIQFGFQHCFLCKTEESVQKLKSRYNKILSFTIEESKGMEYEFVILYNFFHDSCSVKKDGKLTMKKLWLKVLNNITIVKKPSPNLSDYERELLLEDLSRYEIRNVLNEFEYGLYPELSNLFKCEIDNGKLFPLCSELKELYVALTRAKSLLFIYEEDQSVYPLLRKILEENDLVETNADVGINFLQNFLASQNFDTKQLKKIADEEFNSELYKQAEFHYNLLQEHTMEMKSRLCYEFIMVKKMKSRLTLREDEHNSIKSKDEKDILKDNFLLLNKELLNICEQYKIDAHEIKGELLINLNHLDEALSYFLDCENYSKCGFICKKLKRYEEAIQYYRKADEYANIIECYDYLGKYKELFNYIHDIKLKIDLQHYLKFYKKYSKNYLRAFIVEIPKNNFDERLKDAIESKQYLKKDISFQIKPFLVNFTETDKNKNDTINNSFSDINDNEKILGLNIFPSVSFNSHNEKKKYQLKSNYTNKEVFTFIPDYLNISKTDTQKENCVEIYKNLRNFICVFVEGLNEKTKRKDIEYYDFANLKLELNTSINSRIIDTKMIKIMNNSLLDIEASNAIITTFKILVTKNEFMKYFNTNIPLLYLHKMKGCHLKKHPFINQTLTAMVEISRKIGLNDLEMISVLKSILLINGHYEQLLPLLTQPKLLIYAAILKKRKLLLYSLNKMNISFSSDKPVFDNNYFYIFNAFLSTNIVSFFNVLRQYYIYKSNDKIEKLVTIAKTLQPYDKIYSIIYSIFKETYCIKHYSNQISPPKSTCSIIVYLDKFLEFFKESKLPSNNEILKLIEIGNSISLVFMVSSLKSFGLKWKIPEKLNEIQQLCKLMEKIASLIEKIKGFSTSDITNKIILFSLFSALGISIYPNLKEFNMIHLYLKVCILSSKSIIFWSSENFDSKTYLSINFDSNSNNYLITYQKAFTLLHQVIFAFSMKLENKYLEYMERFVLYYPFDISFTNITINIANFLFRLSKRFFQGFGEKNEKNVNLAHFFKSSLNITNQILDRDEFNFPFYESNWINFSTLAIIMSTLPYGCEFSYYPFSQLENYFKIMMQYCKRIYCCIYQIYQEISKKFYNFTEKDMKKTEKYNNLLVNYILFVGLISKFIKIHYYKLIYISEFETENRICSESKYSEFENILTDTFSFSYFDAFILLKTSFVISPILKIIWIKKIYSCIFVLLKEKYVLQNFKMYNYNKTFLDYTKTKQFISINDEDDDINKFTIKYIDDYFNILLNFIKEQFKKEPPKDNNSYNTTWIRNYFELELYLIYLSFSTIKETTLDETINNKIIQFKDAFNSKSFFRHNMNAYKQSNIDYQEQLDEFWFYESDQDEKCIKIFEVQFKEDNTIVNQYVETFDASDLISRTIFLSDVQEFQNEENKKEKEAVNTVFCNPIEDINLYIEQTEFLSSKYTFD